MSTGKGKIFVISAPSGAGKTSIVKNILSEVPLLRFSVSATTRKKREGEVDGTDYFFITREEFIKKIENNEFVEWEKCYDYYYGTPKNFIDETINKGNSILLDLDVKGAFNIKKMYSDAVLIFIEPPNFEELKNRLEKRQTETEEDLKKRIERAEMEMSLKNDFDFSIVNNKLQVAIREVQKIIEDNINKGEINGNQTN